MCIGGKETQVGLEFVSANAYIFLVVRGIYYMKKQWLVIPLAALMLASCSSKSAPQENLVTSESASAVTGESNHATEFNTAENPALNGEPYTMILSCDETVYGSGNQYGFYETARSEDGSYHILFTDYETKEQVFLCADSNCSHDTASCTALLSDGSTDGFEVYPAATDDNLFLLYNAWDGLSRVEMADTDGGNRHTLCELESGENFRPGVAYKDGYLVFMTRKFDRSGENPFPVETLHAVDTHTGERTVLYENAIHNAAYEENSTSSFFLGVTDTGFLMKTIATGQTSDIQQHTVFEIPFTGEPQRDIASYQTGEMQGAAHGDKWFYLKNCENGAIEFGSIQTTTLEDSTILPDIKSTVTLDEANNVFIRTFVDEWAIVTAEEQMYMAENGNMEIVFRGYAINTQTGEIKSIGLSNHYNATQLPVQIYAENGDALLVEAEVKEENNPNGVMNLLRKRFAMIAKSDYINSVANYSYITANSSL